MQFQHFYFRLILFCSFLLNIWSNYLFAQSPTNAPLTQLDSIEIFRLKGDVDIALEIVDRLSSTENSSKTQATQYLEKAELFRLKRNFETAQTLLDSAENLLNDLPGENGLQARLLFYRGKLLKSQNLSQVGSVSDSVLLYYDEAFKLLDSPDAPLWVKSEIAFDAGRFLHRTLGEMKKAGIWYGILVDLMTQVHDASDYRRGYYLLYASVYYNESGDYERSILLGGMAAYIMKNSAFPDNDKYVDCLQIRTNSYYESEKYAEAAQGYGQIIALVKRVYGEHDPELIVHYVNISQPLLFNSQYNEAIAYCRQAESLILRTKQYEEYLPWIFNNLAEAHEHLSLYNEAEKYFKKSIEVRIRQAGFQSQEVHEGLRYFGEYFERRGQYKTALEYYQKSMTAIFGSFDPADLCHNPDFNSYSNTETLFYVLFDKADALMKYWRQTGDTSLLHCASELYSVIYARRDELLNSGFLDKSSMQIFHRFADGLDQSVACSVALYEATGNENYLEQAWQYMEKNKYFLLHKALATTNAANAAPNRKLDREVAELSMAMKQTANQDSAFFLCNKLLLVLSEKSRAVSLKQTDGINISSDSAVLNMDNISNLINSKSEALVEYHWSKDRVYTFLMHQGKATVLKSAITPALLLAIKNYSATVSKSSTEKSNFILFAKSAYTLYSELFKPVEDVLHRETAGITRVIIIPDGPLATLPFEAFIATHDTTSFSYWGLDYLCKKYVLNYAYSLRILQKNMEKTQAVKRPGLLALSYSPQLDPDAASELYRSENELPYSAEEILRIKKIMPAKCFLGADATETKFKTLAPEYSMIHLALHGRADTTDMFNSRLIFKRNNSENEDGELRAFELYDMDLSKLQLAVLSACETGLGEVHEGEGIFSIARGFAYAGCPSLVMSLWKVNDKTTADLVDYFYKNLSLGQPKDEALRNAKLSYLKSADDLSAHPANWAAFIALGNNSPVQLPETDFLWEIIAFLFLLTGGGYFVFRKYSRKYSGR